MPQCVSISKYWSSKVKGDQGREEGDYGKGLWSSEREPEPLHPRATHNNQSWNFRGNFAYMTFMPVSVLLHMCSICSS